jgi:hypothetical protein
VIIESIERGGILKLIALVFLDKSFVEIDGHGKLAGREGVFADSMKFRQTVGLVYSNSSPILRPVRRSVVLSCVRRGLRMRSPGSSSRITFG